MWHRRLWLIDHGATLYFHHLPGWQDDAGRAREPFALIKDHVLAHRATMLNEVDSAMASALSAQTIDGIVEQIPEAWLAGDGSGATPAALRAAYGGFLRERAAAPRAFVEEAARVR